MPIIPNPPGVHIEEAPSGLRTITGVSTSTTAFIGSFPRGPLDSAIRCANVGDWERHFGGLRADDETGYAIQQFFLNGGSEAWVVRVASVDATNNLIPSAAAVTIRTADGSPALKARTGRRVRGLPVDDPGGWGNSLHLEVDHDTSEPDDVTRFNLIVSEATIEGGRRVVNRVETYTDVSIDRDSPAWVVDTVNEDSELIQLTPLATPPNEVRPAQTGTTGSPVDKTATFSTSSSLDVNSKTATLADLPATGVTFETDASTIRRALERAIRAAGGGVDPDPHLMGASVTLQTTTDADGAPRYALRVLAGEAGGAGFDPATVLVFSERAGTTAADLGLLTGAACENVQQYRLGLGGPGQQADAVLGHDGAPVDAAALVGQSDDKTGLHALRDVDRFDILCLPTAATLKAHADIAAVYAAAEAFCEAERAFLIVDVPPGVNDIEEVQIWLEGADIRHPNAAVYFPRVQVPDPLEANRLRSVGASGTMAGVYARTDRSRGVWKAPAGQEATLHNVQAFDTVLTDRENGAINPLGINGLRQFPIHGRVAWGARTLFGADVMASEWKYVPVRRLALFLEESLVRGLQWAVSEPNDASLWAQIRFTAGAFMHNLFRQGAFRGATSADAYFVRCDGETTTRNDIDLGFVNLVVGFAPLKPAEFVVITIQQRARPVQS
jgi:phage tail sheath protein FI